MMIGLKILLITSLALPLVAVADEVKKEIKVKDYVVYVESAPLHVAPAFPGEKNTSAVVGTKLSKDDKVTEEYEVSVPPTPSQETSKDTEEPKRGHYTKDECKKPLFTGQPNRQVYDWIYTKDWACVKTQTGTIGWIHRMFIK
jgi:hypothetical protein